MTRMRHRMVLPLVLLGLTAGCATPSYVNKADEGAVADNPFSQVVYQVHDAYDSEPPGCIAVLPFKGPEEGASTDGDISLDQTETVRRALYAHLSPQGKRDVEIPRVDFVLAQMSEAERDDLTLVGDRLNCDALVSGEVTEYGSSYFALYSRVAVGAELRMIRSSDGSLLWEGQHVAVSHGGEIPLSPVGLAMGLLDAARNMNEEQIFRVIDDLTRRLVKTIPDNRIAVLEEPLSPVQVVSRRLPEKARTADDFLEALESGPRSQRKFALVHAIEAGRFDDEGTKKLHEALIALAPGDAGNHSRFARYMAEQGDFDGSLREVETSLALNERDHTTHFLKATILIKTDHLDGADAAIVQAIALDDGNAVYFNGLGYVNSVRGNPERALVAYGMALERDPANGYAYYNTGVILYSRGELEEASDAFYGAGLAYLKSGSYGQAKKAVADLKELASQGLDSREEIQTLEEALKALTEGGEKNV